MSLRYRLSALLSVTVSLTNLEAMAEPLSLFLKHRVVEEISRRISTLSSDSDSDSDSKKKATVDARYLKFSPFLGLLGPATAAVLFREYSRQQQLISRSMMELGHEADDDRDQTLLDQMR